MSASNGSGLFSKQGANIPHLAQGAHGMTGEIADIRRDVSKVLAPLVAVAVEEYTNPPAAVANNIMLVTASSKSAQTYSLSGLNGSLGGGAISPPRNIEVVTAGATPTNAPASVTINGIDAQGNVLSETIPGTNGGSATYAGAKCFAKVTSVVTPAAADTDATFSVGTGVVIGLSQTPKLRAGLTTPIIRQEIYNGAVVTTGALTTTSAHPPFGAYTPADAPNGARKYAIEYEYDASLQRDG